MFLLIGIVTGRAYDFKVDGFYYNIVSISDRTVEVTHSNNGRYAKPTYNPGTLPSYTGDIVIPSSVEFQGRTFRVIGIGEEAFAYSTITSIKFPPTVKYIGSSAFFRMEFYYSFVIPKTIDIVLDFPTSNHKITIEESDAARTGESSTSSSTSSSSSNTGNVGGSTGTSGGNASSSGENNAVQFRKEPSSSTTESTKSEGTKVESKPESNTVESKPTTDNNSSTNTDNNNTNTDNNSSSTNTDNNNTNTDNNNSSTNTDNNNTNTDNNNSSTNTGNNNGSNINTNPIPETPPSNNNSSNNTNNNTNSNYIGSSNNGNKYSNNNNTTTPVPEESNNVATTTPSAPESDNSIIDNSGNELSVISIDKEPTGSQGTTSKSNDGGSVIPIVLGVGAAGAAAVAGAKIIKDRKEQSGANETDEDNFNQENNDSDFSYIGDYNNGFENDNKDESGKYKAGNVNKLILDDTPEDIKIEENFSGFDEKGEELE